MREPRKPLLFLDVDGVISLFDFAPAPAEAPGTYHWVDGVAHCIPADAGERLVRLSDRFQLVWATGWEDRANEHLPTILGLPFDNLPTLNFGGRAVFGSADWKLDALADYAGDRAIAWVDDNHDKSCRAWADRRHSPTLLVSTRSAVGLTDDHVERLIEWADIVDPLASESTAKRSEAA